jgi:hypothetical protein
MVAAVRAFENRTIISKPYIIDDVHCLIGDTAIGGQMNSVGREYFPLFHVTLHAARAEFGSLQTQVADSNQ